MKTNKRVIQCSFVLTIGTLIVSIIFQITDFEYIANIFAGIFASTLLTLLIAIINYNVERTKVLEKFYTYALKAVNNFNCFENEGDIEATIDIVIEMNKFDYTEFDISFGEICFLFNNKRNRQYIYKNIYFPIVELRKLIIEKTFHFKEYRKATNGNRAVMKIFIDEIDNAIMDRDTNAYTCEETMVYTTVKNKIVEQLRKELDGRYYKILYPKVKRNKCKKNKCVNQRRREFYRFDIEQEQNIYTYLCKGKLKAKALKKLSDDLKFETYAQWKQYIWNKYHEFSDEKLEEFSRYLNQRLRNIKPAYEYLKMIIPVILALVINEFFKILVSIVQLKPDSMFGVMLGCGLIILVLCLLIYATIKIAIQLSDEEDERNFYLDYKEIIDEMIEERNVGKLQRFY